MFRASRITIAAAIRAAQFHDATQASVRKGIDELIAKNAKLLATASPAMLKAWSDAAFAYISKATASTLSAKLSAPPANLESGECEAFLVVGGGPRASAAQLSAKAAYTPPPVSSVQRQLAENAAACERIEADKAARFSRNWGDERTARHVKLIETYMSIPLGTAERQKFFAENEREIWQAQKTVQHLKATRGPAE